MNPDGDRQRDHDDAVPVAWIETVAEEAATGYFRDEVYARMRFPNGTVPNVSKALSLWPKLLAARAGLQKELQGRGTLGPRRSEMLAVMTASLLGCHD